MVCLSATSKIPDAKIPWCFVPWGSWKVISKKKYTNTNDVLLDNFKIAGANDL